MILSQTSPSGPPVHVRVGLACPRCDSRNMSDVPPAAPEHTALDWHQCHNCCYLWATPRPRSPLASLPNYSWRGAPKALHCSQLF
jgi:hypothetical protein